MNKFEVVLIFNPDTATSTLKNEIEKIKADCEEIFVLNFSISDLRVVVGKSGLKINTTSNLFI